MLEERKDFFFGILGSLHARISHRPVSIASGKQRTLLAALLLNLNEAVSTEELVGHLWSTHLPCSPRSALQTYLTRLRQLLDQDAVGGCIRTIGAGYLIEVPPETLDLCRFRRFVNQARDHARNGRTLDESVALRDALALWRGRPLHDVPSESLQRDAVPLLTEEWLRATERYQWLLLALGRSEETIGGLRELTQRYPYHERFRYQLMLALRRSGRRCEALETYRQLREKFRDELGVEPGSELSELHLLILRNGPDPVALNVVPPPHADACG